MNRTQAQKRSEYVLDQLQVPPGGQKDFTTLVQGLPAMILQNGLGHSMAFLLAKKDEKKGEQDRHLIAFRLIAGWLRKEKVMTAAGNGEVVRALATMDQSAYLQAQGETLKLLEWVKRYAKAGLFA
ncbi:MAG: type III-B CRISPR module-associated protein Cmr5 [Candidatus Latescibacterota bacterium]